MKGRNLVVAGITDRAAERTAAPMPDLQAALDGTPKDTPIILMAHRPDSARANADAGVDLQLSGHTHGGQVLGLHYIAQYVNGGLVSGLVPDRRHAALRQQWHRAVEWLSCPPGTTGGDNAVRAARPLNAQSVGGNG